MAGYPLPTLPIARTKHDPLGTGQPRGQWRKVRLYKEPRLRDMEDRHRQAALRTAMGPGTLTCC